MPHLTGAGHGPDTDQPLREEQISPDLFQGIYEQVLGIPTAGRGQYSRWLGNRWQDAVQQWALATTPELRQDYNVNDQIPSEAGTTLGRFGDPTSLSFRDWLNQVKGTEAMFGSTARFGGGPGSIQDRIGEFDPERLSALVEDIGTTKGSVAAGLFDYATRRNLQNRFGRLAGAGMFRRAMSEPAQRQYQVQQAMAQDRFDDSGQVIEPDTFLQSRLANLRARYGF